MFQIFFDRLSQIGSEFFEIFLLFIIYIDLTNK